MIDFIVEDGFFSILLEWDETNISRSNQEQDFLTKYDESETKTFWWSNVVREGTRPRVPLVSRPRQESDKTLTSFPYFQYFVTRPDFWKDTQRDKTETYQ